MINFNINLGSEVIFFLSFIKKLYSTINTLILGFHLASLLLVTFINQLMHSINTVVDVKICVV